MKSMLRWSPIGVDHGVLLILSEKVIDVIWNEIRITYKEITHTSECRVYENMG